MSIDTRTPSPEGQRPEYAPGLPLADLRGSLVEAHGEAVLSGLRTVVDCMMRAELVTPEAVMALHPQLDRALAESFATSMSLSILAGRVRERDKDSRISTSDLQQVLAGTRSATVAALHAVALGFGVPVDDLIANARILGSSNTESS